MSLHSPVCVSLVRFQPAVAAPGPPPPESPTAHKYRPHHPPRHTPQTRDRGHSRRTVHLSRSSHIAYPSPFLRRHHPRGTAVGRQSSQTRYVAINHHRRLRSRSRCIPPDHPRHYLCTRPPAPTRSSRPIPSACVRTRRQMTGCRVWPVPTQHALAVVR